MVDKYLQPLLLSHSKLWLEPQQYHMPAMETEAERQPFLSGDLSPGNPQLARALASKSSSGPRTS